MWVLDHSVDIAQSFSLASLGVAIVIPAYLNTYYHKAISLGRVFAHPNGCCAGDHAYFQYSEVRAVILMAIAAFLC